MNTCLRFVSVLFLEDRSHMETLFTGLKLTGRKGGSVCRVWYGPIRDLTNKTEKPGKSQKTKITHFRIVWLVH